MNYAGIIYDDIANGPGVRVTLFVQGCFFKCPGCQNPETWDDKGGQPFTQEILDEIFKYIEETPFVRGLTISGGEPLLYFKNLETVHDIVKQFRRKFKDTKDIWIFTGSTWKDIIRLHHGRVMRGKQIHETGQMLIETLGMVDVIVEGPFISSLKDPTLKFRGSSNQHIIDLKKTFDLLENTYVEWKEDE